MKRLVSLNTWLALSTGKLKMLRTDLSDTALALACSSLFMKCLASLKTWAASRTSCTFSWWPEMSDSSCCNTGNGHTLTLTNQDFSCNMGHSLTNEDSSCCNTGHTLTNKDSIFCNTGNTLTNQDSNCSNTAHAWSKTECCQVAETQNTFTQLWQDV